MMLLACNVDLRGMTPPGMSVCAEEHYAESWICKTCLQSNIMPEDLNGIILDGYTLMVLADEDNAETILDFTAEVRDVIATPITWNRLIAEVFEDARKSMLIASMLQRRLNMFASDELIQEIDLELIRYHLDQVDSMLVAFK
jgi:hypothetical protein